MLKIKNLNFHYNSEFFLNQINLEAKKGEFIGLLGPNGSGKTTLFKLIAAILKPDGGEILFENNHLLRLARKQIARLISIVPQVSQAPEGFSVFEIVAMGRFPHLRIFERENSKDIGIVEESLAEVNILDFAERDISTLSGGEYQRVLIARALAQQTRLLLLDEPVSHLDLKYQIEILELLQKLKPSRIVLATFHDLDLAGKFCDRLWLLAKGSILADGSAKDILTIENISRVFDLDPNKLLHLKNYLLK